LWKIIQSITETVGSQQQNSTQLTANDLIKFFKDMIKGIRQSIGNVPVQPSLLLPTAEFSDF
jgi:hypothetical protein